MSCASIDRGSGADCDNIPEAGTQARLILINWDQVSHVYVNDDGKIVAIQFRGTSYKGYEFLGFKQDVKKSEGVVKTNLKNRFTHSVEFIVYEVTQEQKNNLKKMSKGRFMAIVELNGQYSLTREALAFNGSLFMDAKVSQTATGWKSLILKAVDPLFRRDGRTVIPIKIGGTRNEPSFGLDARRVLGR